MTKDLTLDKKIIGVIGAFLFISPNLNIPESILMYCGIESHDIVRLISIGFFAVVDLALGILFLRSKPGKKECLIFVISNIIYIFPLLFWFDVTEVIQYLFFVVPVTIFALKLSIDDEVKEYFFLSMKAFVIVLFVIAIIYISLLYFSKNRDYGGVLIIKNLTHGDMGYLFLNGFVISLIGIAYGERKIYNILGIVLFSVAILFAGNRSAILCAIFGVILWIVLLLLKAKREKIFSSIIVVLVLIVTVTIGSFIVPDGSRLHFINYNISSPGFSLKDLLYETREEDSDIMVIYTPTGSQERISDVYENEIVTNDGKKSDTEKMLRDDVVSGRNEYITLVNKEDIDFVKDYSLITNRLFLWRVAIKEYIKHPIFGNGPRYFVKKYDGYYPHNIILEVMADFGAVGLVVLVSLGLYCFIRGVRYYKKDNSYYGFGLILLLFSHIPRYLLYTTIYSNPTIAMTIVLFITIGRLGSDTLNKRSE